jgi:fermentation-respiration switch protein FrsA (DUF1100 family)
VIWQWVCGILGGIAVLVLLFVFLGAAYMYRYAHARKPFPWSTVKPDCWETEPTPRVDGDGKPFDPCGCGALIREADQWLYRQNRERGVRYTLRSCDGLTLAAHYIPADTPQPRAIILMVHGYRSSALWDFAVASHDLHDAGFGCFLIDQRAHGESGGKTICYGAKERYDVRDWARFIEKEFPGVPVILDGVSMGAATVMAACGLELPENVRGVVADCGFTTMEAMFNKSIVEWFHLPTWPLVPLSGLYSRVLNGFGYHDVNSAEMLTHARVPVLLVHGEADSFVPFWMGEEIWDAVKEQGNVTFFPVPEADHALSYLQDADGYRARLNELFARCGV